MGSQVVFYRLSRKVVNDRKAVPEEAKQVMYYSLAIGHHVGVMDCLSELASVPLEDYRTAIGRLPTGEARSKLEGVMHWDEIEINRGHAEQLLPALSTLAETSSGPQATWIAPLIQSLHDIVAEPALYLMVRLRP